MINTRTVHLSGGGRAVTFDVTPESIKTSEPMISKKKELLAGGYLYVGAPGLRSRSIDTFIPAASEILEIIESWRVYGQRLTVAIPGLETIAMKITDMSTTVKEGDADIWIASPSQRQTRRVSPRQERRAARRNTTIICVGRQALQTEKSCIR